MYLTPMGGVRWSAATDMSGGEGFWTVAQFDTLGQLRVTSAGDLWNGAYEEPQRAEATGTGVGLVADRTARDLLAGILFELVQLRLFMHDIQRNPAADYIPPLYSTIDMVRS